VFIAQCAREDRYFVRITNFNELFEYPKNSRILTANHEFSFREHEQKNFAGRLMPFAMCATRRVVYRYLTGSQHDKALQDGGQIVARLGFFAIKQPVGVAFLAVGGHGEHRRIGDASLDVAEVRAVGEADEARSRTWSWMRTFSCRAAHTTTTREHAPKYSGK